MSNKNLIFAEKSHHFEQTENMQGNLLGKNFGTLQQQSFVLRGKFLSF